MAKDFKSVWAPLASPPDRIEDWRLLTHTTQTRLKVTLPIGLPPGTQVWFTACWSGARPADVLPHNPAKNMGAVRPARGTDVQSGINKTPSETIRDGPAGQRVGVAGSLCAVASLAQVHGVELLEDVNIARREMHAPLLHPEKRIAGATPVGVRLGLA